MIGQQVVYQQIQGFIPNSPPWRTLKRAATLLQTCNTFSGIPGITSLGEPAITRESAAGVGQFGAATRAKLRAGGSVILKRYHAKDQLRAALAEIIALVACQGSPHVVQLVGIVNHNIVELGGDLELATTLAELGSLEKLFAKQGKALAQLLANSPTVLLSLAQDITDGLAHIHSREMIHRDISLRNLVLTGEGRVQFIDFGLARFMDETGEYPADGEGITGSVKPHYEVSVSCIWIEFLSHTLVVCSPSLCSCPTRSQSSTM